MKGKEGKEKKRKRGRRKISYLLRLYLSIYAPPTPNRFVPRIATAVFSLLNPQMRFHQESKSNVYIESKTIGIF